MPKNKQFKYQFIMHYYRYMEKIYRYHMPSVYTTKSNPGYIHAVKEDMQLLELKELSPVCGKTKSC